MFLAYLLLIVLATPFSASWPVKIVFWGFSLFLYWILTADLGFRIYDLRFNRWWLLLPLAILITSRLLPFFHWGDFPLGADAAIYLKDYFLPPLIIYSLYLVSNFLLAAAVYFLVKKNYGREAAFFSLLIFSLSLSQFLFYWAFLPKMMLGAIFTLIAFYFLKDKPWLAAGAIALTGIVHPPAFLPLFITTVFFLPLKALLALILVLLARGQELLSALYYSEQYLRGAPETAFLFSGQFVDFDFYAGLLGLLYIPFAAIAVTRMIQSKKITPLVLYFLICLILIFTNFLFHNRFIILFDLAAIILAGPILKDFVLWLWQSRLGKLAVVIVIVIVTANAFYQSWLTEPLINSQELTEIKSLAKLDPEAMIVAGDNLYYSVLYGFSSHKVITSGELNGLSAKIPAYIYLGRRTKDKEKVIHRLELLLSQNNKIIKVSEKNEALYRITTEPTGGTSD